MFYFQLTSYMMNCFMLCFRLLAISVLLGVHHGSFSCPNGYLLSSYYIGAIVLLSISIVHAAATMLVSMRGTIRDSHPRRHINILIYLKAAILLPEAVWIIIATYWAFGYSFSCDWTVYWAARGAVICAWIVGFWTIVGIVLVFDPLGSAEHRVNLGDTMAKKGSEYLIEPSKSMYSRVWEMRWDLYYLLLLYIYLSIYLSTYIYICCATFQLKNP